MPSLSVSILVDTVCKVSAPNEMEASTSPSGRSRRTSRVPCPAAVARNRLGAPEKNTPRTAMTDLSRPLPTASMLPGVAVGSKRMPSVAAVVSACW